MRPLLQKRQNGVALITAMLVVAMATIIAADLVWDQYMQMRRTESMLAQEQGRLYALGAENFGIEILLQDRGDVAETDSKDDFWALPLGPLELDEGTLEGRIEDLQGRFNINNIYRNGQKDDIAFKQFERLLELLSLAPGLAGATLDWIDPDQNVCCIGGAEDDTYTSRTPPHWAANRYLTTTTELLAVEGFDIENYNILEPYIAALPPGWCGASEFTPVNVNTADPIVLQALDPNITEADTDQLIADRGDIENTGEPFIDLSAFDGIVEQDLLDGNYLSVNSECFGATVTISIGTFRYSMYSLLDRDGKVGTIITRLRYFGAY